MLSKQGDRAEPPKRWQNKAWVQLLAVGLGVLPLYSGTVVLQLQRDLSISTRGFIFYLAVISPLSIVIALLLMRLFCGEHPRELNLRPGKLSSDLLAVLILSPVIIVANVVLTGILSGLIRQSSTYSSVRDLFAELAGNPTLFALFVGPLLLLGAASEELIRAFLLGRLWKVWPSMSGKLAAVVISSGLFGLIHLYQGPVAVAWTAIFGLIMALYYLKFGRVVPLVLAHYVTNALQVIVFGVQAR